MLVWLVLLLAGGGEGLQAVSYQNFRAGHGQGHIRYGPDGSWSQSFGGGHRSFGSGLRGLGRFPLVDHHQGFTPTTSFSFTHQHPLPPNFDDSSFAPQPIYDPHSPPGNNFLFNSAVPIPDPLPSYNPDVIPPQAGPQIGDPPIGDPALGDDRLPTYSESVAPIADVPSEAAVTGSTPSPEFNDKPAESSSMEYKSEAQTPQAAYQGPSGPSYDSGGGRSFQSQSSGHPVNDGSYQSYDGPRRDYLPNSHSPTPGPTLSTPSDYSSSDYNSPGGGATSNYGPTSKNPSPHYNNGGDSSNYGANSSGPSPDYPSDSRNSDMNARGPSSDYPHNPRGFNSSPSPRGPNSEYGTNSRGSPSYDSRGPPPNYDSRGPPPSYDSRGPPPSYDYKEPPPSYDSREPPPSYDSRGPPPNYDSRGPPPSYDSRGPPPNYNSRGPSSDYIVSKGTISDYNSNEGGASPSYSQENGSFNKDSSSTSFGPEGRGPYSDYRPSPGPSHHSRGPTLGYNSPYRGAPLAGGVSNNYNKPLHSNLQSTRPQSFPNKPISGPGRSFVPAHGFKPQYPEPRGPHPTDRQDTKGRPNFSGEEEGKGFSNDFKSTELGSQSFESDIPDFPSDEAYFNSQEGYGSFEGKGAKRKSGRFAASDEDKGSYERPNFSSGEKSFSGREGSFESGERFGNGDRSTGPVQRTDKPPDTGPKPPFNPERKPLAISNPSVEPRQSSTYPPFPDKRPSFTIQKSVPLRRTGTSGFFRPSAVRLYKRKLSGEAVASFDKPQIKKTVLSKKESNMSAD